MATESSATKKDQRWFPLESNPTLLNTYISDLGFDTNLYKFYDVFSTEDWALGMIPQHAVAVLMLYPLSQTQLDFQKEEEKQMKERNNTSGDDEPKGDGTMPTAVWHMKQRIGNACGTIGVLHSLANIPKELSDAAISPQSWLGKFYSSCSHELDPVAKAELLEGNNEIERMHESATSSEANQTNRGSLDDALITHFVAFVNVDGGLYEMDGRKDGPINHGRTTTETFLADSCKVVEQFMKRDPEELRFTIMALAPNQKE